MTNAEISKWLANLKNDIGQPQYQSLWHYAEALDKAIEALEAQRWIPVKEKLPEDGERVLATHLGGVIPDRQVIEHIYANGKFVQGWDMDMNMSSPTFGQRYMGAVIAWMPLPEPYKEGKA